MTSQISRLLKWSWERSTTALVMSGSQLPPGTSLNPSGEPTTPTTRTTSEVEKLWKVEVSYGQLPLRPTKLIRKNIWKILEANIHEFLGATSKLPRLRKKNCQVIITIATVTGAGKHVGFHVPSILTTGQLTRAGPFIIFRSERHWDRSRSSRIIFPMECHTRYITNIQEYPHISKW